MVHVAPTRVQEAAISLFSAALMRVVATSPATRPTLWARVRSARRLAEALGVASRTLAATEASILGIGNR